MGLLNKNEKTSNIFFEDVKSVISKMADCLISTGLSHMMIGRMLMKS